ncbi:hypothetical protein GWK47_007116 [Chionoecetes opilio]|uniref:Uncharacterized protein n=1 Tax=Chionoecetes opilio TaxID=41210 RepID=A0A8J5CT35_CHIOP|nr:hypothetical protein GWK47_007116 [Chionoecetes opilio]
MERVAVDIVGPLPQDGQRKSLCVCGEDYFTKGQKPTLPNHVVPRLPKFWWMNFSQDSVCPRSYTRTKGGNSSLRCFRECCQLLDVQKDTYNSTRPQSDGMVEKVLIAHWPSSWQELPGRTGGLGPEASPTTMAYRSAEHEATGYSPARLMCGRELRLPLDLITGRPPDEGMPTVTTPYAPALKERMEEIHHKSGVISG